MINLIDFVIIGGSPSILIEIQCKVNDLMKLDKQKPSASGCFANLQLGHNTASAAELPQAVMDREGTVALPAHDLEKHGERVYDAI